MHYKVRALNSSPMMLSGHVSPSKNSNLKKKATAETGGEAKASTTTKQAITRSVSIARVAFANRTS